MVEVYRSTVIDRPVETLWALLRDFNAHHDWHPAIKDSVIEAGKLPDQVGCVRRFRLQDGTELREQLLSLSDYHRSYSYCILDAPLPLIGYVATLRLKPVTDGGRGRTFWEWFSRFDTPPGRERELAELVGGEIYQAGFEAVRQGFAAAARPPPCHRPPPHAASAAAPTTAVSAAALTANAVVVERYGGPGELRWRAIEVPPPGPGEVRIRHTAIGLNYVDVYCRSGYFDLLRPPGVPGMEAAGEVTDVGPGVDHWRPGDRVGYACLPVGAYAELRTMSAELLVPLPAGVDDQTAAGGLLKGMTAEFLLHRLAPVGPGDSVLVHAAAGGVGLLLCQWAARLGALVIGTAGSAAKAQLAAANGCRHVIRYERDDFVERVRGHTDGRGADVVFDAVGRDTFMRSFDALAVCGHLVSYGQASGPLAPVDLGAFAAKSARVSRPNYGHYLGSAEQVRSSSRRLFDAIEAGHLSVQVKQRYPLAEAGRAHADLEARRTVGASVLLP